MVLLACLLCNDLTWIHTLIGRFGFFKTGCLKQVRVSRRNGAWERNRGISYSGVPTSTMPAAQRNELRVVGQVAFDPKAS